MSSTFDSHPYTVGSLVGDAERRSIVLPRFQRGFSWEESHIERFWSDLTEFKSAYNSKPISASYFLGPIVLQPQEEELILLDGQQRLATATILLSCIRDLAREINKDDRKKHSGHDLARDIQTKFIQKGDLEPVRHSLILGELDEVYFNQTIKNDPPQTIPPKLRSHRLILSARNLFNRKLAEATKGQTSEQTVKTLRGIRDCLTKGMTMVAILIQSEEDAYTIFETLNDRGLRLSVPDLLLNLLMRRAGSDTARDNVRQKWNYMLQELGKRDISRFLRHMWLSKYGDLKARGLFAEIKDHLEKNAILSLSFAEASASECDNYISILDVDSDIPNDARDFVEGLVRHFNATATYPVLLSGLACLNESDFRKLAQAVSDIVVRYSVFANLNPSLLESTLYQAAREIRGKQSTGEKSSRCLSAAKVILSKINPSDATVKENGKEVDLTRQQATWLIRNLAKALQSKTKEIGFDKANLEHVFPENAGPEWPNRKDLLPYLWRLGNLTHLGKRLNRNSRNRAFKDKCREYYSKSEITMSQGIAAYNHWTEAEIRQRTKEMLELVTRVWARP